MNRKLHWEVSLRWKGHTKGNFYVTNCYKLLSDPLPSFPIGFGSVFGGVSHHWNVDCFTWLVTHEACLIHENLQKKGVNIGSRCSLLQVKMRTSITSSSTTHLPRNLGPEHRWCQLDYAENNKDLLQGWYLKGMGRKKNKNLERSPLSCLMDHLEGKEH